MKRHDGFYYPDDDTHCRAVLPAHAGDIDRVIGFCQTDKRRVCVQAGGNVGVFAKRLSTLFEVVYTFEPDPDNFACLCANVSAHNVIKLQAALGANGGRVELNREPGNCGAHAVRGLGNLPVLALDSFELGALDLLYLDIEGYEYYALSGAIRHIISYRPVIVIEDKGLSSAYNIARGACERMMSAYGYHVAERLNDGRDVILVS